MNQEKIGKFIAELRKENNMTQEELAQKILISRQAISKWERGVSIPDSDILLILSNLFKVSVNEILLGERINETNKEEANDISLKIYDNINKRKKTIKWMYIIIALVIFGIITYVGYKVFVKNDNSKELNNPNNNKPNLNENNQNKEDNENKEDSENNYLLTIDKNIIKRNEYTYLIKKDNNNIYDVQKGTLLYDSERNYSKSTIKNLDFIKDISLDDYIDISEYLKYFFWMFPEENKTEFTSDEIAIIVSLAAVWDYPVDNEYVQKIAKQYFGVDNYILPTGTYEVKNFGKYSIMKQDDFYIRSNVLSVDGNIYGNYLTKVIRKNNNITLYFDYAQGPLNGGCYNRELSDEEKENCRIGTKIVELKTNNNNNILVVNKMTFNKK